MEFFEQVNVKVDSKGRIYIPARIRIEIGDSVTIKRVPEGFLFIPSQKEDTTDKLRKIIHSKHERNGKPEQWSPEKMKSSGTKASDYNEPLSQELTVISVSAL
jgi:bifunctional DNA-binding transcriptional regulator/antitoxin component of YhaV-PrlF toxin-antitoxin module